MHSFATIFVKLAVIVVAIGAVACSLLVIRQQRIEAAHQMSQIHQRLGESERTLWKLRTEIASACRPDQVRRLVKRQGGEWTAIPAPRPQHAEPARPQLAAGPRRESGVPSGRPSLRGG